MFYDRRPEIVAQVTRQKEHLQLLDHQQARKRVELALEEAQSDFEDLQQKAMKAEVLRQQYNSMLQEIQARLSSTPLQDSDDVHAQLLEAQRKLHELLHELEPAVLETAVIAAEKAVSSLKSQYETLGPTPEDHITQNTIVDFNALFYNLPGEWQLVRISNSVTGRNETRFELSPLSQENSGTGTTEKIYCEAQSMKFPKMAFPPEIATLFSLETMLTGAGLSLLGDPAGDLQQQKEVQEAGGFYEIISYSSATGRHQGSGSISLRAPQ